MSAGGVVAVVHNAVPPDAPPDERDVLVQAAAVAAALERRGHPAELVPADLDLARLDAALRARAPSAVFNLVESLGGHASLIHLVPALAEALGLAFTGAGAASMLMSSNKLLAKQRLHANGLATPAWTEHGVHGDARRERWIVKPVWEDASVGVDDSAVVSGAAVAELLDQRRARHGGRWFAERFIDGRELNVALLADVGGPQVLPLAEIEFRDYPAAKPRIVGYDAKWRPDSFEYCNTPRRFLGATDEPALQARIVAIAQRCWSLFDPRGYARVDLRVDAAGEPWVLELNANPCLAPDAGFVAALDAAGLPFDDAVARILAEATRGDTARALEGTPRARRVGQR